MVLNSDLNLNENEIRALVAICNDCDELDGWGFTRPRSMMTALLDAFNENARIAGGYLRDLIAKGLVDLVASEDEVWVAPQVFALFC